MARTQLDTIIRQPKPANPRFIDLTNRDFERLTVIEYYGVRPGRPAAHYWRCRCSCGGETVVRTCNLTNKTVRSCGCLAAEETRKRSTTHGQAVGGSRTREYRAWAAMKERCGNPTTKAYPKFGGRGVKVCRRWLRFENFLADMGPCPPNHALDRRDDSRGYTKSNCRWATAKEKGRSMRSNRFLTFRGETLCLTDWAERAGLSLPAFRYRLSKNWPLEIILTRKPHAKLTPAEALQRQKCRNKVTTALRNGTLVRPERCSIPGCTNTDVEAHHPSYEIEKALDVVWVCATCHHAKAGPF